MQDPTVIGRTLGAVYKDRYFEIIAEDEPETDKAHYLDSLDNSFSLLVEALKAKKIKPV